MPLLAQETKVIVFSDFDGTITWDDSNGTAYSQNSVDSRLFDG